MSDLCEVPDDATPLTAEEKRDLISVIPAHITYRRELNEAEQNIARAQDWALNRPRDPVSEKFIKELHRGMLGEVWRWAGKFRTSASFETMKGRASHSPPSQTSITGARRPIERARHSKTESLLFPGLTRDMFAPRLRRQSNRYNPLRASHRNASTSP
jgi:fido (protein-threonine AMPylation protein)